MLDPLKVVILSMLMFVPLLVAPLAVAQDLAPDVLVRTIAKDVMAVIKQDKDIQAGNPHKIADLIQAKILPHFDFTHTTMIAMGVNWRRATAEQQEQLTREFRTLLLHTYSRMLTNYHDQTIAYGPVRALPGDIDVIVRSEIRQSGMGPIAIEYQMERTPSGWKIYDLKINGVRLATTYRDTFAEEIRNQGIDGLIGLLSNKNRQNGA